MNETRLTTLEQVRAFLAGTAEVGFCVAGEGEDRRYGHIAAVLARFGYPRLKKPDKGLILRYLQRTTGYSRQQLTRLVRRWRESGTLRKHYRAPRHGWVRQYTDLDVALQSFPTWYESELGVGFPRRKKWTPKVGQAVKGPRKNNSPRSR